MSACSIAKARCTETTRRSLQLPTASRHRLHLCCPKNHRRQRFRDHLIFLPTHFFAQLEWTRFVPFGHIVAVRSVEPGGALEGKLAWRPTTEDSRYTPPVARTISGIRLAN